MRVRGVFESFLLRFGGRKLMLKISSFAIPVPNGTYLTDENVGET